MNKEIIDFTVYLTGHSESNILQMYNDYKKHDDTRVPVELMKWHSIKDSSPKALQTVWLANSNGFVTLGCLVESDEGWHWASSNGVIYSEDGEIISECESDDYDVEYWHPLPKLDFIKKKGE